MKSRSLLWITLLVAVTFLLPAVTFAQLAGDYTIPGTPYATLKAAIDALNSDGASGVVRFLINQDLTESADSISQIGIDGTTASLVIKPAPNKTPTITFKKCAPYATSAPNSGAGLALDGITQAMSNITIDGSNTTNGTTRDMTFKLSDTTNGRYCILVAGNVDNVTIKNLNITVDSLQLDRASGVGYTFETAGIAVLGSTTTTGKVADNLIITNCNIYGNNTEFSRFKNGIYNINGSTGGTWAGPVKVTNNVVNVSTIGIYLVRSSKAGSTKTEVSGNTVSLDYSFLAGYTTTGIAFESWQDTMNVFNNKIVTLKIQNNGYASGSLNGISFTLGQAGSVVNCYNNFVGDFHLSGSILSTSACGIDVRASTSTSANTGNQGTHNIYYNTVYLNSDIGGCTGGRFAALRIANNTKNVTVVNLKNNILVNRISNPLSYAIDCLKPSSLVTSDYNDFYADTVGNYSATNYARIFGTIKKWQDSTSMDAHSKSVNPANPFGGAGQLTSLTNLHWVSQPVFAFAGTPILGYTKDIDGDTRNATNPYMGADENATALAVGQQLGSGPRQFALDQNYPNPFNPSTAISYSVAQTGWVSLKIFDLLGREVATLVNEVKSPGTYKLTWDASASPSGVYFYKLTAGGMTQTHKMQLVK